MDMALAVHDREALALLVGPVFAPADGIGVAAPERFAVAAGFLRSLGRRGRTVEELVAVDDELTARLRGMEALVWGAWTVVNDRGASVDGRLVAISFLGLVSGQRAAVLRVLTDWLLEWDDEGDLRPAAVAALVETGDEAVPGILLQAWALAPPRLQEALFSALLTRESWTQAFLGGLPDGMPLVLDAARQARLLQHPSAEVRTLAAKRLAPTPLRAEVLARFQPALQLAGDPEQGRATFIRLCVNCHRDGEVGVEVGPNLQSVVDHPPEKLLTNILAPNVDVQPGYHAYQVRMRDGTDVYGLVASETGNSLTFKAADGTTRVILRQDVASLQSTGLSLMPEGLEAGLTPQDLADLISYLKRAR
jgi:putative heme-binding domain-containing protein